MNEKYMKVLAMFKSYQFNFITFTSKVARRKELETVAINLMVDRTQENLTNCHTPSATKEGIL